MRVPSAQSTISSVSEADAAEAKDLQGPPSPGIEPIPEHGLGLTQTSTSTTSGGLSGSTKVDVSCQRPGEDMSQVEDGPLFRATMKSLEQKTGTMRGRWKKVLKRAESALEAQVACNNAVAELMESLKEASTSNANAVQPAIDHYFDKIAKEILAYERSNAINVQRRIIDPISRLYNVDIKQAEAKKKDFDEESSNYYAYVSRYLGHRSDSLKEKKRAETDLKYQSKRRNFELKRFDYSSFMQDLHGGRKDQEVLSHLTRYADAQAKSYLEAAKKIEVMIPQLEALSFEVKEADKEFQLQRTEREEKRRLLEKSTKMYIEPESSSVANQPNLPSSAQAPTNGSRSVAAATAEGESAPTSTQRASLAPAFKSVLATPTTASPPILSPPPNQPGQQLGVVERKVSVVSSPSQKFKGIRDLEDKDYSAATAGQEGGQTQHRKEGLLWALSKPGSHVDPRGLNKQAWHK